MTTAAKLHLKTYLLILIIIIFAPLGSVLLGKGMKGVGSANSWTLHDLGPILARILSSGYIWLGIGSLLTFFVAYMLILSWGGLQLRAAIYFPFLRQCRHPQPLSSRRTNLCAALVGILVISVGVFIVGRTSPRGSEHH